MHTTPTSTPQQSNLDRLLRCVSSGYLAEGCSCNATVPWSVASAAWASELAHTAQAHAEPAEDRFFRFVWRGGVWLAYGLRDGGVRGVYCPTHSARRAERSYLQHAGVACLRPSG